MDTIAHTLRHGFGRLSTELHSKEQGPHQGTPRPRTHQEPLPYASPRGPRSYIDPASPGSHIHGWGVHCPWPANGSDPPQPDDTTDPPPPNQPQGQGRTDTISTTTEFGDHLTSRCDADGGVISLATPPANGRRAARTPRCRVPHRAPADTSNAAFPVREVHAVPANAKRRVCTQYPLRWPPFCHAMTACQGTCDHTPSRKEISDTQNRLYLTNDMRYRNKNNTIVTCCTSAVE